MTKRYNPPPNWPAPPAGWTPPEGWEPDPAWGPAPQGWQLWSDEPKKSWFLRHKILTGVGAFIVVCGAISALNGGGGDATPTSKNTPVGASEQTQAPAAEDASESSTTTATTTTTTTTSAPATPKPKPTKELTAGQEQAIGAAEDYLSFQAFSRKGLIQQLHSEAGSGFSLKDATFAADHVKVNWNEQAAKAAKDYLAFQHFSRSGLIQQLESSAGSGFTHAQALYGVKKAGL